VEKQELAVPSTESQGLIEIGIAVTGPLDAIDRRALQLAIGQVQEFLSKTFPGFRVRFPRIRRSELSETGRMEPSVLLQQAVEDRDARHWDFAFVVTATKLVGISSPFCFAAFSRPLDAAVFSLSQIDPQVLDENADDQDRIARIARRLSRLMLHALGHLTGLSPRTDARNLLFHPATAEELDAMDELAEDQLRRQQVAFSEIADQRLEEQLGDKTSYPMFAIRAAWINRREIAEAVWAARPWQFPRRLSGLTIAAVSTILLLFLTAEAWDLGLSQTRLRIATLIAISLSLTTLYVINRQQLLVRRGRRRSEQTVVMSVSAVAIVVVGMAITWLVLLSMGLGAGYLLYRPALIANWATSVDLQPAQAGFEATLQMSSFAASLGLLIGALGASFESHNYFRHVIFVDEEI
jgi:putative flippase GtrA